MLRAQKHPTSKGSLSMARWGRLADQQARSRPDPHRFVEAVVAESRRRCAEEHAAGSPRLTGVQVNGASSILVTSTLTTFIDIHHPAEVRPDSGIGL